MQKQKQGSAAQPSKKNKPQFTDQSEPSNQDNTNDLPLNLGRNNPLKSRKKALRDKKSEMNSSNFSKNRRSPNKYCWYYSSPSSNQKSSFADLLEEPYEDKAVIQKCLETQLENIEEKIRTIKFGDMDANILLKSII